MCVCFECFGSGHYRNKLFCDWFLCVVEGFIKGFKLLFIGVYVFVKGDIGGFDWLVFFLGGQRF